MGTRHRCAILTPYLHRSHKNTNRFSKGIIEAAQQPGSENTEPQRRHGSIQRIATPPGRAVATPPEKRRRGVAALGEGVRRQGGGSSRSSKRPESTQAAKKMSAAELAAKKLLLPFIDELSFIEIALAEVNVFRTLFSTPSIVLVNVFIRSFYFSSWIQGHIRRAPTPGPSTTAIARHL